MASGMQANHPAMVFTGNPNGAPQMRPGGVPNGMYGAGGVPGAGVPGGPNMGAFAAAAGNPQIRAAMHPSFQQNLQQQQQQQQQIAVAQQYALAQQQAQSGGHPTPGGPVNMPQQSQPMSNPIQLQQAQQMNAQRMALQQQQQHAAALRFVLVNMTELRGG